MYLSIRHIAAFLHLVTLDSTSVLPVGVTLNSKIDKKHKNIKTRWHLTNHEKDTCLRYQSWNKKTVWPYLTSAGNAHQVIPIYHFVHCLWIVQKPSKYFLLMERFMNSCVLFVQGCANLCIIPELVYVLPKHA